MARAAVRLQPAASVGEAPDAGDVLDEVLQPSLPVLPYDGGAAERHAEDRERLTSEGRTPPYVYGQIAAVTAVHQLVVVTLDASQFRPFVGLKIEEIRGDEQVAAAEGRRRRRWLRRTYGRSHKIDKLVLEEDHVKE